ncbi:MAG: TerC family protein [Bdellovibrionota bacterium]
MQLLPHVGVDDLIAVGFLVFLEGVLSIDNALVLALIVNPLPKALHKSALYYGLLGAIIFRIFAISIASYLMKWTWVKFVGGAYLVYLAVSFWWRGPETEEQKRRAHHNFWMTVLLVELTDIAFAADSILTAVALSKKLWVVVTGGVIGLLMMRFAASMFIKLLERFPRFEPTAYILVFIVGLKLLIDGFHFPGVDFHSPKNPAFWAFWIGMLLSFGFGFTKKHDQRNPS